MAHEQEYESLEAQYLRSIRNILMGWTIVAVIGLVVWVLAFMYITA